MHPSLTHYQQKIFLTSVSFIAFGADLQLVPYICHVIAQKDFTWPFQLKEDVARGIKHL